MKDDDAGGAWPKDDDAGGAWPTDEDAGEVWPNISPQHPRVVLEARAVHVL